MHATKGIKSVMERFLINVSIELITGDFGGGGAVQHLHPQPVVGEIMSEDSKETNCTLHGMQKSIENAPKLTMEDQGFWVAGLRLSWITPSRH